MSDTSTWVDRALRGEKHAVATLVSLFEDRRPSAASKRSEVLHALDARADAKRAAIVGLTGTPGSGKSSLLSRLVAWMLGQDARLTIAVVAVDPSSTFSGGALLGDRTRMQFDHEEPRLFFRSQASATELGGLSPTSFQVCGLLSRLFDCVLVETVGIGQSEADIRNLADRTFLVLQPLGGDEVQFLKAGIMEIPDAFILNKSDEPSAERSYHQLRSSIWLARPTENGDVPIYRTSARTGLGIEELGRAFVTTIEAGATTALETRESFVLARWIQNEWGRAGMRFYDAMQGRAGLLRAYGGLDGAQSEFSRRLCAHLRTGGEPS